MLLLDNLPLEHRQKQFVQPHQVQLPGARFESLFADFVEYISHAVAPNNHCMHTEKKDSANELATQPNVTLCCKT
jgi:hypothetical protein